MSEKDSLLERAGERAALTRLVGDVAAGGSGLLVIEGAAGLGKTELLNDARGHARTSGLRVLSAHSSELEQDFSFGIVRQLFERCVAESGPDDQDDLLSGAASPARLVVGSHVPDSETVSPSFATLHGLYWLTVNLAAREPLLLVMDDLHWCDDPSLRWLSYLIPRLEGLPVGLIMALRPEGEDRALLNRLLSASAMSARVLRPAPLTEHATERLLQEAFGRPVDQKFTLAFHRHVGGNPLYLHELVDIMKGQGVPPEVERIPHVGDLGAQAVVKSVGLRLALLGEPERQLAYALALLDEETDADLPAAVAGLDLRTALEATGRLAEAGLLKPGHGTSFAHPIVRSGVLAQIPRIEQAMWHARIATALIGRRAPAERVAAHLLGSPPGSVADGYAVLDEAASHALDQGAPDIALTYLKRALLEPLTVDRRLEILGRAGDVALFVDVAGSMEYLTEAIRAALSTAGRLEDRAETACRLGMALALAGRTDVAEQLWNDILTNAPPGDTDLRRFALAHLGILAAFLPERGDLRERLVQATATPPRDGRCGKPLDAVIAFFKAIAGDPDAKLHARRALSGPEWYLHDAGRLWTASHVLLLADLDEGTALLDEATTHIHRRGAVSSMAVAYTYRSLAWFLRGSLAEAHADATQAIWAVECAGVDASRPLSGAFHAEILIEQGLLDAAEAALDWSGMREGAPPASPLYYCLHAQSRLFHLRGDHERGLHAALEAGRLFAAHGGRNPAILPWRSQAALCLRALHRLPEAIAYAEEEVGLARAWGTPGPLGRALRLLSSLSGAEGTAMIEEAIALLAPSPHRLEHAKALMELGSRLRRQNQRSAARPPLRQAIDIATVCGAEPLAREAQIELRATGAYRYNRASPTGLASLTPSEQRITEMAARSVTNREIAQTLFITPKTVEVHLSNAYRKLGIRSRTELPSVLHGSTP
ncbi:helix-turn-helix transcriptional regulator [Spirillospora sp. NPDC048911]|uniref:helix-turn-helix transcriptional regulator n=1 Tax=Spirillospora sp. NPDC048911 TaxID=3364527 RepID=UPI00371D0F29